MGRLVERPSGPRKKGLSSGLPGIADENEHCRPKIAGGDFLLVVHISVEGFADVSRQSHQVTRTGAFPAPESGRLSASQFFGKIAGPP
jgi:hypothetical protein